MIHPPCLPCSLPRSMIDFHPLYLSTNNHHAGPMLPKTLLSFLSDAISRKAQAIINIHSGSNTNLS